MNKSGMPPFQGPSRWETARFGSRHRAGTGDLGGLPAAALVFIACCCALGCGGSDGPPLGRVRGVVTLDGAPLEGALVRFDPVEPARASRGMTDSAGRYTLVYLRDIEGAVVGGHRVTIATAGEAASPERLPTRYNQATTLTAEVTRGRNRHDFNLTSE